MISCNIGVKHIDFKYIEDQNLKRGEKFTLLFDVERPTKGDIYLIVNNIKSFKIDSMLLSLEIESPSRKYWIDTLNINFSTSDYILYKSKKEVELIRNCSFEEIGLYKFTVSSCESKDIEGVTEIGVVLKDND